MRRKVPKSVARRWKRAEALRKLADKIEEGAAPRFYGHSYLELVQREGESEPRVQGHYEFVEGFQDELYDLIEGMRVRANELECECP